MDENRIVPITFDVSSSGYDFAMKPTDFSHDPARFRFSDPTGSPYQTIGWSFVENWRTVKPQPETTADVYQVRHGSKKETSFLLHRPNAAETEYHDVFEGPYKSGSLAPLVPWKDNGPSRCLLRCRSLIRTNPWMSPSGESPPRSPVDVQFCRSWSAVETGMSSLGPVSPQIQTTSTTVDDEASAMMSFRGYRRDDSLLTTSLESDSLYQSVTSDTDTATSLMSTSDVTLPDVFKDELSRDVISGGASKGIEAERSIFSCDIRHVADRQHRESTGKKNEYSAKFETAQNRSKENERCARPDDGGSSDFKFNLQLKRPSFGGKRYSTIADEYEAKTAKWLNSSKGGMTTTLEYSPPRRRRLSEDIPGARCDDIAGPLNARSTTNLEQEIETGREELDIPTYDPPFSSSLQFRRKMTAVRSSLQEKVAMLRREKRMVDEKIRAAKEEDRIRLLQLEKFRRQLSDSRKEMLLRTIDELKRSLAEQSLKLQKLYDVVLLEQRQMLRCQRN